MPVIQDSFQVTINRLTPDGINGYWWLAVNGNTEVYLINFGGPNDITNSKATLYFTDTFVQLLTAMLNNGISLPALEVNINLDSVADQQGLQAQFTGLTSGQLDAIEANFDVVALCKLFGAFELVKKLYLNGNMTLAQLSETLLYLGEFRKITRQKAEAATGFLLLNGDITQAQYDDFWTQWDIQVGT